jgi:hypothetical protein
VLCIGKKKLFLQCSASEKIVCFNATGSLQGFLSYITNPVTIPKKYGKTLFSNEL